MTTCHRPQNIIDTKAFPSAKNLIGHPMLDRKGITQSLSDLVADNWIAMDDALDLVDNLMFKNAEKIFKK